ncbi:28S ribosomal protein S29, mitochondrial [Macadamia integrifolia]|uniref:28S ribosomal protein S29, mitochondrial n=1 Tax=Macadamia integrifolia TaxID=60698 RepID=UPI001C4E755F|nr:28S ribosomal protein S29, mitochondrial [Macadamia integrifolia]
MLQNIVRTATAAAARTRNSLNNHYIVAPSTIILTYSHFSSKSKAPSSSKGKSKAKSKKETSSKIDEISTAAAGDDLDSDLLEEDGRARHLAEDEKDKSLDIGPNGRPLFTSTKSISELTRKDVGTYMNFSMEGLDTVLPEGLPTGVTKEFEESMRSALLVRQSFLDLRDNFRRVVAPPLLSSEGKGPKVRKQIVLDGPVSCGKSIALAMLVQWAREEGWLVFYVPKGKEWTHGGFFYKNPETGLWDTPVQAAKILQDFLKWNESRLQRLPCQIYDPIPLGEGAGVGWMKGVDSMAMPEASTLYDLIRTGLTYTHAAVGVVVRLRKELSLVKDIPVLIAIDQFNSWFTFSEYGEPVTARSWRPIHARELATVNAFRTMMHNDIMVGAFSHSTAVGKLRKDLPDVPLDARVNFPRYSLDEAASVCHYYLRQRLIRREAFSEEKWKKIYYLSNGNGSEMRWLLPFVR